MDGRQFAPFRQALRADVVRYHGRYGFGLLVRSFLFHRTFRPVCTMRLCQAAGCSSSPLRVLLRWLCSLLHHWAQQQAGIDLPWRVMIGPGFRITHGWGLVVSSGAVIGRNVTVFHGVTVGRKDSISANGRVSTYPTIKDGVWIGPHAVVVGGITVGRGSRIAAGTVVTEDVKPYSIVGGNPSRVIRANAIPDICNPASF
jgi:serine O-acetyltransferase